MVYWILIPSCTQVGCFYLLIFNGLNWFDFLYKTYKRQSSNVQLKPQPATLDNVFSDVFGVKNLIKNSNQNKIKIGKLKLVNKINRLRYIQNKKFAFVSILNDIHKSSDIIELKLLYQSICLKMFNRKINKSRKYWVSLHLFLLNAKTGSIFIINKELTIELNDYASPNEEGIHWHASKKPNGTPGEINSVVGLVVRGIQGQAINSGYYFTEIPLGNYVSDPNFTLDTFMGYSDSPEFCFANSKCFNVEIKKNIS